MSENSDDTNNPEDSHVNPSGRAAEKLDEIRTHSQLAAIFEGCRKFDFSLRLGLDADVARDAQRAIAKLEKSRSPEHPLLPPEVWNDAGDLLTLPGRLGLTTGDYHVYRRPGEVFILRWLEAEQVDTFYERMNAHFAVALEDVKEEERSVRGWRGDEGSAAYLEALEKAEPDLASWYLRAMIREHRLMVLSTQTADEINITYLTEHLMGINAADLVGPKFAPKAEEPGAEVSERDMAWFFKLFALRGMKENVERMFFFTYLQKADDGLTLD